MVTDIIRTDQNGLLNIGGDATLTALDIEFSANGVFDFSSDWTGVFDVESVSDWEATLISGGATLDGASIDSASFADNFEVLPGGGLIISIPEPSSLGLLGLSALFLARRRSRK